MKAWVLHNINDLRFEKVAKPKLARHEVLVAVKAAGICGSDIPRICQTGAHTHPLILGHEFSGVVEKTGTDVDAAWIGCRVGIFPLIPCGSCLPCRRQQYEMCRSYSYLGSRRDGGFAEYVAVPEGCLVRLPESVSFEEAAMLEPMAVAVHAMRKVMHEADGTVVVCGLGTIGLLLLMFLREAKKQGTQGVDRILVVGNKESQRQAVQKMGLPDDCYCDSKKQDVEQWIMQCTQGGANVFFECVGKNETLVQAVNCTAPAGKIMLIGNPYSDMQLERHIYWKILRNQLTVMGTWNSSFRYGGDTCNKWSSGNDFQGEEDDWQYVLKRLEENRITPADLISHRFALGELEQGFQIMRDKTEDYIKIMSVVRQ